MDIKDQDWINELNQRIKALNLEKNSIEEELSVKSNLLESLNKNKQEYLSQEYLKLYSNILLLQHRYVVIQQYLSWFDTKNELEDTDEFFIVKYGMMVELKKDKEPYSIEKLSEDYIKFLNVINQMNIEKEISSRDAIELQERLYFRYASYIKRYPVKKETNNSVIQLILDQQTVNFKKMEKVKMEISNISAIIDEINGEESKNKTLENRLKDIQYKYDLTCNRVKKYMLLSNLKKLTRQQNLMISLEEKKITKEDYIQLSKTSTLIEEKECIVQKIELLIEEKEYLNKKKEIYIIMFERGEISEEELMKINESLKDNIELYTELKDRLLKIEEDNKSNRISFAK